MVYTTRPATPEDISEIAPLWRSFLQERADGSPGMAVKSDFDIEQYLSQQLQKPLKFGYILQSTTTAETVGILLAYVYDEAPPSSMPEELKKIYQAETPFSSRRIASALGLYVKPEHRHPDVIEQLIQSGIDRAEALKVNDIDLLIGAEQTGLQALLQRMGFQTSAIQLIKHYPTVAQSSISELPDLHPQESLTEASIAPSPQAIPLLRDDGQTPVKDARGETVWLPPLQSETGEPIFTSQGKTVYPIPLKDPQTRDWLFDNDQLVLAPILLDECDRLIEHNHRPVFCPPMYERSSEGLKFKRNSQGQVEFAKAERDSVGNIVRTASGKPKFQTRLM